MKCLYHRSISCRRNDIRTPSTTSKNSTTTIYFFLSFFDAPPLVLAVPRRVFCLFLRCLPIENANQHLCHYPKHNSCQTPKRTLLSACTLKLGAKADSDKSVSWLKLLQRLHRVVDQSEAGALATTILRAEAENRDLVFGGLVEFGEFCP